MVSKTTRRGFAAGLGAAAAAPQFTANAQSSWPERTIKMVVPFPPGGAADFTARVVSQKLAEFLKQPVVIDNRPGAGTTIANDTVAKAAPDGYTLLQANRDMTISPSTYKTLPYDTLKAFEWIGNGAYGPFILVANPNLPAKTLTELAILAKAKPGAISYGNLAVGGIAHLGMEALMRHLGIDLLQVPYKGAGPALIACVSGEINVTMTAVTGAIPFVREGRLRGIAVGADSRVEVLPDVPTVEEAGGGKGTVLPAFFGLAAPAGTPKPIIERLSAEMKRVMSSADVLEKVKQAGLIATYSTPAEFAAEVARDIDHFGRLVKAVGIPAQ